MKRLPMELMTKKRLGLFFSQLGAAYAWREKLTESYIYLNKGLELGKLEGNNRLLGHTYFRLAGTCANLGRLEEAVRFGEQAKKISGNLQADLPLHRVALGVGITNYYVGNIRKLKELGNELQHDGIKRDDPRNLIMAKIVFGLSNLCAGDYQSAIFNFKAALEGSVDSILIYISTLFLGNAYLLDGKYEEALSTSDKVMQLSDKFGIELLGSMALAFRGYTLATVGDLNAGLQCVDRAMDAWNKAGRQYALAAAHGFYGQLYLRILEGKGSKKLSFLFKNIKSLIKLIPGAFKKGEQHFQEQIKISKIIGAKGLLAQAYLGLGLLNRANKRKVEPEKYVNESIKIFKHYEAEMFLKQAKTLLENL